MKTTNPRDLALAALKSFDQDLTPPPEFLTKVAQRKAGMSRRDRALAFNLAQGVIRWRLRLDWILGLYVERSLSRVRPQVLNILRLALYQILFLEKIPESAAVNEAVNQAKRHGFGHSAGFVNGVLRNIVRGRNQITYPDRGRDLVKFLAVYYSYPQWLVKMWTDELGPKEAEAMMESLNRVPQVVLRVNTLRTTREELAERLDQEGVQVEPTRFSPFGLKVVDASVDLDKTPAFKQGLFVVQGEAAQLCSMLLLPLGDGPVLDLCAGQGGKSIHLAELSGAQALVVGLDTNHSRLLSLANTSQRLGIHKVSPVLFDATGPLKRLFPKGFTRVFLDSPCSGLGTISKNPDIKWSKDQKDIVRLASLQRELLMNAFDTLAPGGRLLYATCTVSRTENEKVVEYLLKKKTGASLVNAGDLVVEGARELVDQEGFFRAYPHKHGLEGFFGALITKA